MMSYIRLLSATALAGTLFLHATAFAQTTPPPATTAKSPVEAEEQRDLSASADGSGDQGGQTIVVTGSRIPRPETDGVLPGFQVSSQVIESRGFTNVLEALNDLPLTGAGASPLSGNNGGQTASLGAAFVDLLDLGTARTLTLVNGRRFVSGNSASLFVAGNETGSQVDLNVIPSALVERIDTVTVGGAAAYGADAVAGVVNVILKNDFDGIEARAVSGISERGDAGQYQLSVAGGKNFADGRGNVVASFEYSHNDGLQATARDFRNVRPGTYNNPFNGGVRNPNFTGRDIINQATLNNGAFLRNSDDGQPATLFGLGLVTQTLSNPGSVLNVASTNFYTPYTPITATVNGQVRTSNYISLANGTAPVGFQLIAFTPTGQRTTIPTSGATIVTNTGGVATGSINNGFWNTAGQIIQGVPGAALISGNGLNGRTTQAANVPFTTFAPTALPGNVTAGSVLASYGVTAPTGASNAQITTLAVNLLQANRFTAREFLAANPNVNLNYFIGTFAPDVPRIANTDTSLVNVKVNGATVQVPVNQVLPFVSVPLEFNDDGTLRSYTFSGPVSGNDPLNVGSARGGNGGFQRSLENTVLRTQQDRYIANLNASYKLNDELTVFTENIYSKVKNKSLGNISGAQNFLTQTQEAAALMVNYNNPYLTAQNRSVLDSVGITPTATNQGNFLITRQNQDLFGANPFEADVETYRIVAGVRSNFEMLGKSWNAEISAVYGDSRQRTKSGSIADIEYQLALDSALDPTTNTIRCRAQLFPQQYLGRTPVGTAENITRVIGADGLPTETLVTPTITQAMIDQCKPLNPFGYNNMSAESKQYVTNTTIFRNVSKQTLLNASVGGGLFDLPAGTFQVNINGEYRKEELAFFSDTLNRLGRTRSAPSANTSGQTETYEVGGEIQMPLTSPDFLPFMGRLTFQPGIRVSQQNGSAASYRTLAGNVVNPRRSGDPQTIYSLAGTWQPIRDIMLRGNYTRSVRQPSIVELFLGGQPSFTTPVDYCGPSQIDSGATGSPRRANCIAAAIANGNATDATSAAAFLQNFVPLTGGLQGAFNGNTDLSAEKGESWTVGGVLTPRFIPGLVISADYINVAVTDTIVTAGLSTQQQTCYDSPTFPNPTPQVGTNTCANFGRDASFQLANGFSSGFLNLGAINVEAINGSITYPFEVGPGRLTLRGNAYYLIRYDTSSAGDFSDRVRTAGSFSRPKLTTQLYARYEVNDAFFQAVWNYNSATNIQTSVGDIATIEQYPYWRFAPKNRVDLTVGMDVSDRFRFQFLVSNVTDQTYAGDLGYIVGTNGTVGSDYFDQIGRRFQVSATTRF